MMPTLRVLLGFLGFAAIVICASILFLGASETAWTSERVFEMLTGWHSSPTARWPATMDSELRFYAPFWGAYGLMLLGVAWHISSLGKWIPYLAAVFFAGGIGRAISWAAVGAPHPFFLLLMAIELVYPIVLILVWYRVRPR